jgi:hypothetical protein
MVSAMDSATFEFAGGVRLRIQGPRSAVAHFTHEYGPCLVPGHDPVDALVTIGRLSDATPQGTAGGHKTVGWRVAVDTEMAQPLALWMATHGRPQSFVRSLVQGYFVEPLVSLVAPGRGVALVPAAAIALDDGLVLVLGRSRAGKSTLAARAMANGRTVLGDDQVFVDRSGRCWPFPRRLRFYPDLAETAPAAYARLRPRTRRALVLRRWVARLSRGWVRPSLAVDRTELAGDLTAAGLPIHRIVIIERSSSAASIQVTPALRAEAVETGASLLEEQRTRLADASGAAWKQRFVEVQAAEASILSDGFASIAVERIVVPDQWAAGPSISALTRQLGLDDSGPRRPLSHR